MKDFLSKKKQSKLTAWVVGGLLCASASSAANLVAAEEATPDFTAPLLGTEGDQAYIDAGVRQADGTYLFTKDSWIAWRNARGENPGAIRLLADLKIDAADHVLTVKSNTTMGSGGKTVVIKNNGKNLTVKAGTFRVLANIPHGKLRYVWGILNESGTTTVSGRTEIDGYGSGFTYAVAAQ